MPSVRFSRDKRGYEYVYLVHSPTRRGKPGRTRTLYWYRTPPGVRIGRQPFDPDVQKLIEQQNPGLTFDWDTIVNTPMPPPDMTEYWRERRRQEKAARQERRASEAAEAEEAEAASAEVAPEAQGSEAADGTESSGDLAAELADAPAAGAESGDETQSFEADAPRKRRRRRGGRRRRGEGGVGAGQATQAEADGSIGGDSGADPSESDPPTSEPE